MSSSQSLSQPATSNHRWVHYFAIGAMMNPVSIKNRNIHPISSEPAELLDHRLEFFSSMGYADAIHEQGSSLHGVVHVITEEEIDVLDKIEIFYKRKIATARLYSGEERQVQVYYSVSDANPSIPDDFHEPGIPQERYLDVLIAGAKHYGVKQSYIDWLKNHEKVPRPTPDTMRSIGCVDGLPIVSHADVQTNNGFDGRPLWISVNGKVLESCFPPDSEKFASYRHRLLPEAGVVELHIGKVLYDPMYGVIKTWDDITPEYAAWCEHWLVEHFEHVGDLEHWKLVGRLESKN